MPVADPRPAVVLLHLDTGSSPAASCTTASPTSGRPSRRSVREGHVLHVESFVVPAAGIPPELARLRVAREAVCDLDRKVQDVVVVPTEQLPGDLLPGVAEERQERTTEGRDAG